MIHGDLHTGSIMLTPVDTRVIDPGIRLCRADGLRCRRRLGNLLIAYFAQAGHEETPHARNPYRTWILRQVEEVWTGFHKRFLELWHSKATGDAYVAGTVYGCAVSRRHSPPRERTS